MLHFYLNYLNLIFHHHFFMFNIIGDHPELQFESGNQIGGTFPCMCGANVNRFNDFAFSSQHTLISLEQRRKKVLPIPIP